MTGSKGIEGFRDLAITVVLAGICIWLSYLLGLIHGALDVSLSLGTVVVLGLLSAVVGAFWGRKAAMEKIEVAVASLVEKRKVLAIQEHMILDTDTLTQLEARIRVPEIWVITENLNLDVPTEAGLHGFRPMLEANTKVRGIRYLYIVPEKIGEAQESALRRDLPQDLVKLRRLTPHKWDQRPYRYGATIIYNPGAVNGHDACCAYFEYPDGGQYWGKVGKNLPIQWADGIRELLA